MKAIILLGAPGAGKGTLAEGVKNATAFIHVSTGDMLRAAIKAGTSTGLEAKAFMEKGELVPDDVILRIVGERLAQGRPDDQYMFDGFPRTLEQARRLDDVLAGLGGAVDQVFLLEVPVPVIVSRLSGRRICKGCGAVYHVTNIPSKVAGICDQCGGALYQRPDDSEAHRPEPPGSLPAADGQPHRFLRAEGRSGPRGRRDESAGGHGRIAFQAGLSRSGR
jgi:adenylate kinase